MNAKINVFRIFSACAAVFWINTTSAEHLTNSGSSESADSSKLAAQQTLCPQATNTETTTIACPALIQVIANPHMFLHKRIFVFGYLSFVGPGHALLYTDKNYHDYDVQQYSLSLDIGSLEDTEYDYLCDRLGELYVDVEGTLEKDTIEGVEIYKLSNIKRVQQCIRWMDGRDILISNTSQIKVALWIPEDRHRMRLSVDQAIAVQREAATSNMPVAKTLSKAAIEFRLIPPGTFEMGSRDYELGKPDEDPRIIAITQPFYLGKYEITQGQWKRVLGAIPTNSPDANPSLPVSCVTWHECTNFLSRLCQLEGLPTGALRLPTEAEWEYACRAGSLGAYYDYSQQAPDSIEWHLANSSGSSHDVGRKQPNAWGLHDMLGNVSEWCFDWYAAYAPNTLTNPCVSTSGVYRVVRGGSWRNSRSDCRSATRRSLEPGKSALDCGFRCVLTIESETLRNE